MLRRRLHSKACVEVDTNRYSVPWQWIGHQVRVLVARQQVRVYHREQELAVHPQSAGRRQRSIQREHLEGIVGAWPERQVPPAPSPEAAPPPPPGELQRPLTRLPAAGGARRAPVLPAQANARGQFFVSPRGQFLVSLDTRCPRRVAVKERLSPPRFPDDPCVHALLSDPGGVSLSGRYNAETVAFRYLDYVGSADISIEALSHSLHASCVRFAGGIAPAPRHTRFRWMANPYRLGTCTRWAAIRSFRFAYPFAIFPPSRLCLAQPDHDQGPEEPSTASQTDEASVRQWVVQGLRSRRLVDAPVRRYPGAGSEGLKHDAALLCASH